MSWAADTVGTPIAGSWDGGQLLGIGVKGSEIPSTGESGPSYLYVHASLPTDDNVEFRGEFLTIPSGAGITFDSDSYGRFNIVAPDGIYTAIYNLYRDGVLDGGSPYQIDMIIGAAAPIDLVIQDIEQASELENITLSRSRTIAIQGIEQASELENVAVNVGLGITLNIHDIEQASELDNVSIARAIGLQIADIQQRNDLENIQISRALTLNIQDVEQASELDDVVVSINLGGIDLVIQDIEQASELENVAISRNRALNIQDVEQASELQNVVVGRNLTLNVDDIEQASDLQNVQISIPGSQVYGGSNSVLILSPQTNILLVTKWRT